MTIVAHHPIVVELEGIFGSRLVVDVYLAVGFHFQLVAFIGTYATFIDGQVFECNVDGFALFWYPDGTLVVACPVHVAILWIHLSPVIGRWCVVDFDALH